MLVCLSTPSTTAATRTLTEGVASLFSTCRVLLLLPCCRDHAISAYTAAGLEVAVLGDSPLLPGVDAGAADAALMSCLTANEGLLHRAVLKRPLSVLKYAMTLDGKIATGAYVWCVSLGGWGVERRAQGAG